MSNIDEEDGDFALNEKACEILVSRYRQEYQAIVANLEAEDLRREIRERDEYIARLNAEISQERTRPYRSTNVEALLRTIDIMRQSREHGDRICGFSEDPQTRVICVREKDHDGDHEMIQLPPEDKRWGKVG